jgi:hypothetical protein
MLGTKGLVLSNVSLSVRDPCLIEYKDCIGLMPLLDLLLIRRTILLSLATPILDNDLVVMISSTH